MQQLKSRDWTKMAGFATWFMRPGASRWTAPGGQIGENDTSSRKENCNWAQLKQINFSDYCNCWLLRILIQMKLLKLYRRKIENHQKLQFADSLINGLQRSFCSAQFKQNKNLYIKKIINRWRNTRKLFKYISLFWHLDIWNNRNLRSI